QRRHQLTRKKRGASFVCLHLDHCGGGSAEAVDDLPDERPGFLVAYHRPDVADGADDPAEDLELCPLEDHAQLRVVDAVDLEASPARRYFNPARHELRDVRSHLRDARSERKCFWRAARHVTSPSSNLAM